MAGKTVLLVDDEKEVIELLKRRLEAEGYNVLFAFDGPEALEKAKELPNLILLDIMIPGIEGLEVLRRLKSAAETKHIPVIMVTAKGDSKFIFEAENLEATDYIIKPIELKELLGLIKKHI